MAEHESQNASKALKRTLENLADGIEKSRSVPEGYRYICGERFVLNNGQAYVSAPRPPEYPSGEAKQCFSNSTYLALTYSLVYVEGYVKARGLDMLFHHAWCVAKGSNLVIDVTLKEPGVAYFGVPFSISYVKKKLKKNKTAGLIMDLEHGYPLFRNGAMGWQYLE